MIATEEMDNIITVTDDETFNTTEVVIAETDRKFYVRHRGTLLQIPVNEVPCITYDPDENRIVIICDRAPENLRVRGIPVQDERDAERLTHILITAVQKYHERLALRKRNAAKTGVSSAPRPVSSGVREESITSSNLLVKRASVKPNRRKKPVGRAAFAQPKKGNDSKVALLVGGAFAVVILFAGAGWMLASMQAPSPIATSAQQGAQPIVATSQPSVEQAKQQPLTGQAQQQPQQGGELKPWEP